MARLTTLVWLKWRLWWNGLRGGAMAVDTAVAVVIAILGTVVSLALAFGIGAVVHLGLRDGDPTAGTVGLQIFFWVLAFLAVIVPVVFGMGESSLPLSRLAMYPVSRRGIYGLSVAASVFSANHLFWYPILVAVTFTALFVDRVPVGPWSLVVGAFMLVVFVWCHTARLVVQRVMGRRSVRELAALIGLVVVVTVSLVPAIFQSQLKEEGAGVFTLPGWLLAAGQAIASVFPSSIAAEGLNAAINSDTSTFAFSLVWLTLWFGAGTFLGYRLLVSALFEGGASSGGRRPVTAKRPGRSVGRFGVDRLRWVPLPVRAIAAKELHYLMRSTTGKFNIAIMPVFVIVVALVVTRDFGHSILGIESASLVFVGTMVYASMFSNNFLFNSYSWERAGIRTFFVCPVSTREVVLGKNFGVWLYNLVLFVLCIVTFCVVAGPPPLAVFATGVLAFVASLLLFTIAGNFVSASFPVARDISKISNSPSQTGVLASFALLAINLVLIGVPVFVTSLMGVAWIQPLVLVVLIAIEFCLYRLMLPAASRLVEERCESLVEAATAAL